ncbi:MAG: hypothetical protein JTJ12_13950, partial [Eubacterium sp.]|nr:hypothetical protein [Eubacterium sp.]
EYYGAFCFLRGEGIWGQKQKTSALSPKSPQPLFNSNKTQPKTAREEIRYPIFVASELRDCSKMLEKADVKIIDFDDFVFCTTESKSITFNVSLFIEDDFS